MARNPFLQGVSMIRSITRSVSILALTLAPLAAFAGTPVDVKVEGMHCGACVKMVNDELAKLEGVEKDSIKVALEGNHATLTLKKDDPKTREAVEAAVKKAGYKVAKIEILGDKKASKVN
jgi:copper chaperone CopZ